MSVWIHLTGGTWVQTDEKHSVEHVRTELFIETTLKHTDEKQPTVAQLQ